MKRIAVLGMRVAMLALVGCSGASSSSSRTSVGAPSPVPTTVPFTTTTTPAVPCTGVTMARGQADIDAAPAGTTFCLSGTHKWSLTPKAGQTFIGPAVLDGGNSTAHAFTAVAPNVTLDRLTIRRYSNGDQDAPIHISDNKGAKATASGWHLKNLDVGFNSHSGSGTGDGWTFTGGRFHDNRQEGIGGPMGDNVTVDGVEIDHNNFTNTAYTTRNRPCGDEAGGIKWVTDDLIIRNSFVHDNACKGIWADLDAERAVITNNRVVDNWDEGIFVEISSNATVTNNTVSGNGKRNYNSGDSGCSWLWGGGITLASSDRAVVSGNILIDNCNGITGIQQDRPDGDPGRLEHLRIHDNVVSGAGTSGVGADNGADLASRRIRFVRNKFVNEASFVRIGD